MSKKIHSSLPKAWILTQGLLKHNEAKTAHGLIRYSARFKICGIIDDDNTAGLDAGVILDGVERSIKIFASLEKALKSSSKPTYLIIGIATVGGKFPKQMIETIKKAIGAGLSIISGLHEFLNDKEEIKELAIKNKVELIDVRQPKPRHQLQFWQGKIVEVKCPIIAVLGQDCAMGKRTTALSVSQCLQELGYKSEMIYTGQTGWLQGHKYGFIFDSTVNDFVAGELEKALTSCWSELKPNFMLIEGQSALRNPSGPCGSEFIISGQAKHTLLIVSPQKKYFDNDEKWGKIYSVSSEIKLIKQLGSTVIGLVLNTQGLDKKEEPYWKKKYETQHKIPVFSPNKNDFTRLAQHLIKKFYK